MRAPESTSAAGIRDRERAVLAVRGEQALREQLAHDAAPLLVGEVGADAPGGERVVAVLAVRGVSLPRRMSMSWPAPKLLVALALQPHDRGHAASGPAPCRPTRRAARGTCRSCRRARSARRSSRAGSAGGTAPSRRARAWRRGAGDRRRRCARSPGLLVDHAALLHDVLQSVGEPGGRPARRRGRRGPSPGSSPRRTSAGRRGRRSARRACRCPCRTRSSRRRRRRPRGGSATACARARRRRGRRGTAGRSGRWRAGTPRSSRWWRARGRRRCPRPASDPAVRVAPSLRTKSSSCLRTSFFGAMRYWMLGRSKLDTKCRAPSREQPVVISRCVASVAVAVSAMRGTSGQRSASSPSAR